MSNNRMTVEITDYNDGKEKHQSQEKQYKISFSGKDGSFYGNIDLTMYGEDVSETNTHNDIAIDFITSSLLKHKINPNKRILIAIPTANNIEAETFKSIYRLNVPTGFETHFECFYGYNVDQVRNLIADFAIKNNFDYVLCVDSDIVLPEYTLEALLLSGKDIVTGVYRQRFLERNIPEIYVKNEFGGTSNIDINELMSKQEMFTIAGCGFGGVLVKTDVFRKVGYPYFYYKDSIDFKDTVSEDTFFCLRAAEEGFEIFCIPGLVYGHVGKFTIRP